MGGNKKQAPKKGNAMGYLDNKKRKTNALDQAFDYQKPAKPKKK